MKRVKTFFSIITLSALPIIPFSSVINLVTKPRLEATPNEIRIYYEGSRIRTSFIAKVDYQQPNQFQFTAEDKWRNQLDPLELKWKITSWDNGTVDQSTDISVSKYGVLTFLPSLVWSSETQYFTVTVSWADDETIFTSFTVEFSFNYLEARSVEILNNSGGSFAEKEISFENDFGITGNYNFGFEISPIQARQEVRWSISNWYGNDMSEFIDINSAGLLTWKDTLPASQSDYEFDITAVAWTNSEITDSIKVRLKINGTLPNPTDIIISAVGYKIINNQLIIETKEGINGNVKLLAVVNPSNVSQVVKWSIENNDSRISMDQNGLVSWLSDLTEGEYEFTVKATSEDDSVTKTLIIKLKVLPTNSKKENNNSTLYGAIAFIAATLLILIILLSLAIVKMHKERNMIFDSK